MSSYSGLFTGSYYLSRDNMGNHLKYEHEEKLNAIDSMHNENM